MEAKENTPEVSVVMATFNESANVISKAIQSIISQTLTNIELLIIDDSRNAETIAAINLFSADPRVKIFRSDNKYGFVPALNEGLRQAKGRYIARMDGDDFSEPERLAKEVDFLDKHSDVAVVGTDIHIINEQGITTSYREYPSDFKQIRKKTIIRSPFAHPSIMMRKEVVKAGFYYDEGYKKAEDYELWLRLLKNKYRFANINEKLLRYRVSECMEKKRNKQHFRYALKAKWKNFDFRHFGFSCCALFTGCVIYLMPDSLFRVLYRRENKRLISEKGIS